MPWFYILLPLIAGLLGLIVAARAASAARIAARRDEAPDVALYRRRLEEIDALAQKGLASPGEVEADRAEAARRLIHAAETQGPEESTGGRKSRFVVIAGIAVAALLALGLYLATGRPGMGDEPYAARLAAWSKADPRYLAPPQLAALLRDISHNRPTDPQALVYLGRAEMAANQPGEAANAFGRAARLAPKDPDLQVAYGEALIALAEGKITPDARRAFEAARDLNPAADAPRYYLARARIEAGDVQGGLADRRSLAASLKPEDAHRQLIESQIAEVEKTGALSTDDAAQTAAPPEAAAAGADQSAFIHAMVDRLAKRLDQSPDDPDGWARLVRAEGVLKDKPAQDAALQKARKLFASRPDALARIEAQAKAAPAS